MKRITLIAAMVLIAVATFTRCNTPNQKLENAKENVDQAKEDLGKAKLEYLAEIENFRKETAERMVSNEQRIAELKADIAKEKYETRVLNEKKVAELEKKNRDMKKRMDEFSEDGMDNWTSFKTEFNHDMEELGNALKDFFTHNE